MKPEKVLSLKKLEELFLEDFTTLSMLDFANRYSQVLHHDKKDIHKCERGLYLLKISPIVKAADNKIWMSLSHAHAPEMCFMNRSRIDNLFLTVRLELDHLGDGH